MVKRLWHPDLCNDPDQFQQRILPLVDHLKRFHRYGRVFLGQYPSTVLDGIC